MIYTDASDSEQNNILGSFYRNTDTMQPTYDLRHMFVCYSIIAYSRLIVEHS